MKTFKNSDLIIPISILIQLCIINGILFILTPETYLNVFHILYYNISWLLITYGLRYYPTNRTDRFMTNIYKMFQLYLIYGLAYFAFFGIMQTKYESLKYQLFVYTLICLCITWYRIIFFWVRRQYRIQGGNSVKVVVVGR